MFVQHVYQLGALEKKDREDIMSETLRDRNSYTIKKIHYYYVCLS